MQRNKPPPSKEELEEQEKLFQKEREEEYAAIREQNAIKRKEDDIKLVEVSRTAAASITRCAPSSNILRSLAFTDVASRVYGVIYPSWWCR